MLVGSDQLTDKDYPASDKVKGDIFMLVGATLYGFSSYSKHSSNLSQSYLPSFA